MKIVIVFVLGVILASCSSSPISRSASLSGSSVTFESSKNLKINVGYQDPGLAFSENETQDTLQIRGIGNPKSRILETLDQQNIDVPNLIVPRVLQLFDGSFSLVNSETGKNLSIQIFYGFFKYTPIGKHVKPVITIEAIIRDDEGNKLWRGVSRGGPFSKDIDPQKLANWLKSDRDSLIHAFEVAAESAIAQMEKTLN